MHFSFRLLPLAVLVGCVSRPPVAVEVQRGVPASQLALRITESSLLDDHPIEMIALDLSPGGGRNPGSPRTVVWVAAHIEGQPYLRPPVTLKFGTPVPGYTSSAVPPLVLGRYGARVSAGGVSARTRFRVTAHNTIE